VALFEYCFSTVYLGASGVAAVEVATGISATATTVECSTGFGATA
jgi:hypothetical protein